MIPSYEPPSSEQCIGCWRASWPLEAGLRRGLRAIGRLAGSKSWKPIVSQPVGVAKCLAAVTGPPMALAELAVKPLGILRFDRGQVQMSQEDSVCDHTIAEKSLGITMHDFEEELLIYADLIR